jgi:hypothetical protein
MSQERRCTAAYCWFFLLVLTLCVGSFLTVRCLGAEFFSPDQITQVFSLTSRVVGSFLCALLFGLFELFELFELISGQLKTVLVLYSTYTKFGNTASVSALLTRRFTAKVSPFFRDNSRLSYRKANLKKSSWWGKNFLSPWFFVDFSELKFIPQKTRYKVWKHRRARHMFPS